MRERRAEGSRISVAGWLAVAAVLIAVALAALSGFGHRWGWWHFSTGFGMLRWAIGLAVGGGALALGLVVVAAVRRRMNDLLPAVATVLIALSVVIVPVLWINTARSVPAIHDISTDTVDPPAFEAVLPLRAGADNPAEYAGAETAKLQQAAYPDIAPFDIALAPTEAFDLALRAAGRMGWEIVAADPSRGRIEAVDTTFWYGFRDDVVIRVTALEDGSRIDMRSKSRVGRSDVGTNAARIRQFLGLLDQ